MARMKCVNGVVVPLTPEEEARRDAEEAYFVAHKDDPTPKSEVEVVKDQLAALAAEVETLKATK